MEQVRLRSGQVRLMDSFNWRNPFDLVGALAKLLAITVEERAQILACLLICSSRPHSAQEKFDCTVYPIR
jgi:energy-converting hydrogenase A subunit M